MHPDAVSEEHIDQSVHLPRDMPIITPERAAKGDLVIERDAGDHIRFAQMQTATVMNNLEHRGVIDSQHVHDGQTYEVWQTIFRARSGFRNNPIYGGEMHRMRQFVTEDDLPVDDFGKLIRALGADRCRLIEIAIYTPMTPHLHKLLERNTAHYRIAFDVMSRVMERLREEWRKKQEENPCANNKFV